MKNRYFTATALTAILLGSCLTGCGTTVQTGTAEKEMQEISTTDFETAQTAFALNLLREAVKADPEGNVLLSPYSAMQALAMTANGADGATLAEMEQALGGIPIGKMNKKLKALRSVMPKDSICTANAIWVRDDGGSTKLNKNFQRTVETDYGAAVNTGAFDESTRKDINNWCKKKTDGMIPEILSEPIPEESVLYLLNAVSLDAEWEKRFLYSYIYRFEAHCGTPESRFQNANMLCSDEKYYFSDANSEGFLKYYKGGQLAFAAILPNGSMTPQAYLEQEKAEDLHKMLYHPQEAKVELSLPQFTLDYDVQLDPMLQAMGMESAYDPVRADFSNMSDKGRELFISRVLHKTRIAVDVKGTKAAALSAVEVESGIDEDVHRLFFGRPFVYMVLDVQTMTPVFTGVLNEIPQ